MASPISSLFPKSRKLLYDSHSLLQSSDLSTLFFTLDELDNQLNLLSSLLVQEPVDVRGGWERKISELRAESFDVRRRGLAARRAAQDRAVYDSDRNELMAGAGGGGGGGGGGERGGRGGIGSLTDEGKSLESSGRMMADALSQGAASLSSLLEQRDRMKGVRTRMLDMAAALGVSNSTLRVIERRETTDRVLVFAGMFVVVLLIYFLFW